MRFCIRKSIVTIAGWLESRKEEIYMLGMCNDPDYEMRSGKSFYDGKLLETLLGLNEESNRARARI